jgi:hypothetical protein
MPTLIIPHHVFDLRPTLIWASSSWNGEYIATVDRYHHVPSRHWGLA